MVEVVEVVRVEVYQSTTQGDEVEVEDEADEQAVYALYGLGFLSITEPYKLMDEQAAHEAQAEVREHNSEHDEVDEVGDLAAL